MGCRPRNSSTRLPGSTSDSLAACSAQATRAVLGLDAVPLQERDFSKIIFSAADAALLAAFSAELKSSMALLRPTSAASTASLAFAASLDVLITSPTTESKLPSTGENAEVETLSTLLFSIVGDLARVHTTVRLGVGGWGDSSFAAVARLKSFQVS